MARPPLIDLSKLPKRPRAGKVLIPWDVLQRLVAVHNAVAALQVDGGTLDISESSAVLRIDAPEAQKFRASAGGDSLQAAVEKPVAGTAYPLVVRFFRPAWLVRLSLRCASGAATVDLRKNGVALAGLSGIAVTSGESLIDVASGGFAPGDDLRLVPTAVVDCQMLQVALEFRGLGA